MRNCSSVSQITSRRVIDVSTEPVSTHPWGGQFKPSLVGQIKASKWARPSCHFQDFRTLVGTKEWAALPQAQELRRKATIAKVA